MVVANIDQINNNNMRMTEINTYYGEQYKSYIELIKSIIWFSLPILILSILKQKELLPESILNLLIGLVLLMGISYTLWIYYDFSRRSNMNFSEYEWDFSKPAKSDEKPSTIVKDENGMKSLSETLGMGCIGMECCSDGMTYDPVLNKCVSPMGMPDAKAQVTAVASSTLTATASVPSSVPAAVPANAVTTTPAHLDNYSRKGSEKGYCRTTGNSMPPGSVQKQTKEASYTLESCAKSCDDNKQFCTGFDINKSGECYNWNFQSKNAYEIQQGSDANMGCWINKTLKD
jgi:hypothetical protein